MAASEGRWDILIWDSDQGGWDLDPNTYLPVIYKERRAERGATASGQRQDIARAEAVAPGVARRIDE